jgi:quercetin dioxygenase-like cupin family protein
MHYFDRFDDGALVMPPADRSHSDGYTEAALVNGSTGSVHTGLSMNQLGIHGTISPHVHSFEEGFYVLAGHAMLAIDGQRAGRIKRP